MWSNRDCCFKLLDFDLSVVLAEGQEEYPQPIQPNIDNVQTDNNDNNKYKPVGTRGFIAPELFDGASYSWRTDLYALGASFNDQWMDEVVGYNGFSADEGYEELNEKIYDEFRLLVFTFIMAKEPAKRKQLDDLMDSLLVLYASINRFYSHLPKYRQSHYDLSAFALAQTV
jgi:serine/threonine protein kinase